MRRDTEMAKRDSQGEKRDVTGRDTLARARPYGACHGVTRDNKRDSHAAGRDSDSLRFATAVTVTPTSGGCENQRPLTQRELEQRELFRVCGERILVSHRAGRKVTPEALADGRRWAAYPPLQGPLSAGVPDADLPPALRNGALEVF